MEALTTDKAWNLKLQI